MGQLGQSFLAVCHGKLRRHKMLSRLQAPGKHRIVNSHYQPGLVELIHLCMHMKASAV